MELGGGDHSFATMFPTLGYELSHIIVSVIIRTIDTSSMSKAPDFIHWLNYHSPISPINIDQILSSVLVNYLQHHGAHNHNFSTTFPQMLGNELFDELVSGIVPNINNFSITNASEFFDWLNYNSPISSINIHQTFASACSNSLQNLYPEQLPFIYEDLIDLQELIGHVNVGLTEKTISKNLKTITIIAATKVLVKYEGEICVVCQDEYKLKETIGTLHCGHTYHANCIKLWLLQKNVCPICKATALVDLDIYE